MPPTKRPRLSADDLALLRRWIDEGAPGPSGETHRPPSSAIDVAHLIQKDLDKINPRLRRFARYLDLTALANAARPADEMSVHRAALAKLVNGLSRHPRVTRPQAVDAAGTLYRIDLRDYRWTARQWDRLAGVYPYRPSLPPTLARSLAEQTTSDLPWLRGDWFTATASRPPFYHDLLQLPTTDRALERLLMVDTLGDLRDDNVVRAGFNGSGVARNNRILERHDAAHGAWWRSYDFSDNKDRQNIFQHPLGPAPISGSFRHAGGEIIFHLPNGLFGYLLVDADGRRIDKAPGEIVSDPRRPDRLVENGLSCVGCHAAGLLPKDDQVRAHVLKNGAVFAAADRETILAQYAPRDRFRRLLDEDNDRFTRALEKLGVQAGEPANRLRELPGDPEPVTAVVQRYEGVLDLPAAATEAGLTLEDFAVRVRAVPELARSLGPLLAPGGTVQRQVFETAFTMLARMPPSPAIRESAPFVGHRGTTLALALAPDALQVASGGEDGTVRLWDPAGQERLSCEGHTREVLAVTFTSDSKRVLSGGQDGTLRLWETVTGRELLRLTGHTDAVRAVAVSPDGRWALSGGADGTVRLWSLTAGVERGAWLGHRGIVHAVAFSPEVQLALSGGSDGELRLWDVATGRPRTRWESEGHTGPVFAIAFSADGRRALSGGQDHTVRLWDVRAGRLVRRFTGPVNAVVAVAFSADGRRILAGATQYRTPDRTVRVWDAETGAEIGGRSAAPDERVDAIVFSPGADRALVNMGGRMRPWDLTEGARRASTPAK
jgi:hypothetical protein